MGNVSTIGKTVPPENAVVEVKYLYAHPGKTGKAIQPELLHVRTDAEPADCQYAKLKIKEETEE